MAMMEGAQMPEPAPLVSLVQGITVEVASLVHACLDSSPARRPDAATVRAALERACAFSG